MSEMIAYLTKIVFHYLYGLFFDYPLVSYVVISPATERPSKHGFWMQPFGNGSTRYIQPIRMATWSAINMLMTRHDVLLQIFRWLIHVIRLQRIHNFWCSMLIFYTICLVFRYTLCHFYAFSGTNLLTRCHSASSLFSAVFVFQKIYTGNILGIGRNKSQKSRYLMEIPEHRRGDGAEPEGGHTTRGRGLALARAGLWCGPPGPLLTLPLRL
jgi:hypothetical protein